MIQSTRPVQFRDRPNQPHRMPQDEPFCAGANEKEQKNDPYGRFFNNAVIKSVGDPPHQRGSFQEKNGSGEGAFSSSRVIVRLGLD